LADSLVGDQLAGDVAASPAEAFRAFDAAVETLEPADIKAAFAKDWSGSGPLLLAVTPDPVDPAALKTAWNEAQPAAPRAEASTRSPAKPWASADFGRPGRVVRRETVQGAAFVRLAFDNGVVVNFKPTKFAADSITVRVRLGRGRRGLARRDYAPAV